MPEEKPEPTTTEAATASFDEGFSVGFSAYVRGTVNFEAGVFSCCVHTVNHLSADVIQLSAGVMPPLVSPLL